MAKKPTAKKPVSKAPKKPAQSAAKPAKVKPATKVAAKPTKATKVDKPAKAAAKPKLMAAEGKAPKAEAKKELTHSELAAKAKLTKLSELPEPPTSKAAQAEAAEEAPAAEMRIPNRDVIWKPAPRVEVAVSEEGKKWVEFKSKYGKEKAPTYSMTGQYEPNRPIEHKTLGWGYVLSIENDRLEVLFKEGRRMLISNYRSK